MFVGWVVFAAAWGWACGYFAGRIHEGRVLYRRQVRVPRFSDRPIARAPFNGRTPNEYEAGRGGSVVPPVGCGHRREKTSYGLWKPCAVCGGK